MSVTASILRDAANVAYCNAAKIDFAECYAPLLHNYIITFLNFIHMEQQFFTSLRSASDRKCNQQLRDRHKCVRGKTVKTKSILIALYQEIHRHKIIRTSRSAYCTADATC